MFWDKASEDGQVRTQAGTLSPMIGHCKLPVQRYRPWCLASLHVADLADHINPILCDLDCRSTVFIQITVSMDFPTNKGSGTMVVIAKWP